MQVAQGGKEIMKVYFVRHGYSVGNHAPWGQQTGIRDHFRTDEEMPLEIKYGIAQAIETAQFLEQELKGQNVLVMSSPYKRAKQTANFIMNGIEKSVLKEVNSLREIDAGMEYAITAQERKEMEEEYPEISDLDINGDKKKKEFYEPYYMGESKREVRRRAINVVSQIKDSEKEGFDAVIVVSHNIINKILLQLMTDTQNVAQQKNGSIICTDDPENILFEPKTFVPKEYRINFDDYKINENGTIEYADVADFQQLIKLYRNKEEFLEFFKGGDVSPIDEMSLRIEGKGSTLLLPPVLDENKQILYIDCKIGKENVSSNKKSKSTYFILSGMGEFIIDGARTKVKPGSIITATQNQTCYYEGTMKIIEKMEPAFDSNDVIIYEVKEYGTDSAEER